jgi:integrase
VPALGAKQLNNISTEDIQRLKSRLANRKAKTVNNVLTVLNTLLKQAVKWSVIDRVPCDIELLSSPKPEMDFYDFDDYERLIAAARELDVIAYLIVLLGGEAGLRCGEMMALEWSDVDLTKRQLCVRQSQWQEHVTVPKSGRPRYVPMTKRLATAFRGHRHLRSPRVLCHRDGTTLTQDVVLDHVQRAARRAQLGKAGVHRLRRTFCSHLAMKGAPARAIQELAGHRDLSTTQRYMHLSPAALDSAIRLLDGPTASGRGEMLETAAGETAKALN